MLAPVCVRSCSSPISLPAAGDAAASWTVCNARQQRNHRDAKDVLNDQDAENQLRERFLRPAHLVQDLDDYRRRRHREHRAEEEAVRVVPAEGSAEFVTDPAHHQDFQDRRDHRGSANLLQFSQAELQPERKHEQDNADFGQCVDALFARNQRKRWRVRANDEAGQNVAKHDGLLETMKATGSVADGIGDSKKHRCAREQKDKPIRRSARSTGPVIGVPPAPTIPTPDLTWCFCRA